jgi:filamentous hemagglutinin family protein
MIFVSRTNAMRATATSAPDHHGKRRLLTSCAIGAGMIALAYGGPALAQVAGSGTITTLPAGTTTGTGVNPSTVNVNGPQTIIDWTPSNAPVGGIIDFLPAGNTLNFVGNSVDYIVLNRFIAASGTPIADQIALNGTVNSVVSIAGLPTLQNGHIWFYNAGGILIGNGAAINVGSLVLTTNDVITTGGLLGPTGEIRFRGASGNVAPVNIANGASINADNAFNPGGSYVAIVAPRIVQAGAVRVDGSAAYVAAEQTDIRINSGLFDINVLVGAEGGNVITHTGSTTGPAHVDGDVDQSRIYMVAIPKNDAVTMLVSGSIGYDDAVSASTDPDGAVRLSAGYNIFNGELDGAPANATPANITINDTLFRSNTVARASGALLGQPLLQVPTGGPSTFVPPPHLGRILVQGDGIFIGDASATLNVGAGQIVGATGNLTLASNGANGAAGNAAVTVSGGQLLTGGLLAVLAGGQIDAATGSSTAGTASFTMTGGAVQLGDLSVAADAEADVGTDGTAGTGTGGAAAINLRGGTLNSGSITVSATGVGGRGPDGSDDNPANIVPGGPGGTGVGGSATITIDGAAVTATGTVAAYAEGQGGAGGNFSAFGGIADAGGLGGNGQGGNAAINMASGTLNTGDLIAGAGGFGGAGGNVFASSSSGSVTGIGIGGNGGNGQGGTATLNLAAPVNATGAVTSTAAGQGGNGGFGLLGGSGGDALGGLAQIIVTDFSADALFVNVDASARGGDGAFGGNGAGGDGGDGTGGTGRIQANGSDGRATLSQANFQTGGTGGNGGGAGSSFFGAETVGAAGGSGGVGRGGTLEIRASSGATIVLDSDSGGLVSLRSDGAGGIGGDGAFNGFGAGFIGGDGGDGGAATGGTVRLFADGGTITSNGSAVSITVDGISGDGGFGGTGTSGNGAAGATAQTTGGLALIEAAGVETPALVSLGVTTIAANGDIAGRIEMRTTEGGAVRMTSLTAEALGDAPPTNNDTDEAPAGIFFAANGGTIATTGNMTLTTDSSFGAYARSNGTVSAGGNLTIDAGDQIDIRHDFREGTAPTIAAVGNFTATAGGISGAPGSLLDAGGTLTLISTLGGIGVDRLDANDIVITAAGAASVEHAEAANDFTASGASFRTGLNSIITGGDIVVTSPGAVDLGNSTAGGFVQVNGQSILFNNIDAGGSVSLTATGNVAGADGIAGGSIDAGGNVNLLATRIAITGTITGASSLFAASSAGPIAINLATIADDIAISARGDITGTYNAVGNVRLRSGANINASANATGFESSSSGPPIAASVFADAVGNVTLANSSAAGMFGVNAGGSVSLSGINAGEDILVLAGTTATLTNLTAGDDLTAIAAGGIIANGLTTTGAGPDSATLTYSPPSPVGPGGFQINASPPDLSNIVLTASAGNIGGGNINAFDNLTLTASGAVATAGTLASGRATSITGDSIAFAAIDAGTTVNLSATNAITGANIAAGGDITAFGDSIALTGAVTGDASFFAFGLGGPVAVNQANVAGTISIFADGDLTGTFVAGGDVRLNSNANITASATANGGYVDFNGGTAQGNVFVEAAGNAALTNSAAARMFGVSAGGSATLTGASAGEDMLVIAGTDASLSGVTVGDDVEVRAAGAINAANVRATGAGADTALLGFVGGSGFTINSGEGSSATDGSDIVLSAGGAITASTLSAADDILITTPGAIAINGAATLGQGVTGGSSDIRTQGGNTALAGLNAFTDVLVTATGTLDATGPVTAGRDIAITAAAANLATLASPGGSFVSTLEAGGNLSLVTAGAIVGGRVRAGGDLTLTGARIDIARAQTTGTGPLTLTGTNGVSATNIQAGGTTQLNASNGAVTSSGLISAGPVTVTGDSINLNTGGNIVFAVLDADVGDAVVTNGSGTLTITSSVVAGRAALTAQNGNDIVISALAANAADITSTGNIIVNGVLTARNIALESNDIIIGSGARIGTAGSTETLSIENNDVFSQTFVGGTGTRNGFHLDASELTRLFGTDIEIFAPEVEAVRDTSVGSSAPPDIIVDSFTLAGGAAGSNLGANGALTIRTPGKMRVIGNVQLTGLTDANALNLFADDALEVILGQGTVRLVNGSNAAGQLNMVSDDIIVATTAAIADVGAATTTDAIEARLAQNDGVVLDEGSLFARGIRAEVIGGFYVQNSGAGTDFASRRGLTFGAGGLDVLTEGSASRIVINGVQLGATGQVTGLDAISLLTIGGGAPTAGGFDPRSTFNGCVIASAASCAFIDVQSNFPVQDVIEAEADAEEDSSEGQSLPVPLITMRGLDPLSGEPLLDDPVTGAGNDDLWTPTEGP